MREKQLKSWLRKRKIALIEQTNPEWKDLSLDFLNIEELQDKLVKIC